VSYYFINLEDAQKPKLIPFLLSFKQENYLCPKFIRNKLAEIFGNSTESNISSIYILTQPSYLGFCFNPVSFYYCYGKDNDLLYIISEITNTPWREKHIDYFDFKKTRGDMLFHKNFHVSPFMPMSIKYHWRFRAPQETLEIKMSNTHLSEAKEFFFAQMNLSAKELSWKNIIKNYLRFPLMSFVTISAIYWQALRLFIKRIPFYTHPDKVRPNEH
jgi:hypothetical protein